jgi:glutathione synthase/RimK-type ligase-like ATP-grasp enzyme
VTGPVLVLSNERDYAADSVIAVLHRHGVPVVRWNAETLSESTPSCQPRSPSGFRSIWLRDYLPQPSGDGGVAELDEYLVIRAQWRDWLAALDDSVATWVNPLWASRRAENKVVQLNTAVQVGLRTPTTLLTNRPDDARSFARAQPDGAVIKTLSSGYFAYSDQAFMFTTELTDELLADEAAWSCQPLIVQRRLPRSRDLRVIVVGDYVVAAATTTGGPDWRLVKRPTWSATDVPRDVAVGCRRLVRALGLVYAAIDLVDDGEAFWFLEANQAGEFQFLDRPLGLGIADALASVLSCSATVLR